MSPSSSKRVEEDEVTIIHKKYKGVWRRKNVSRFLIFVFALRSLSPLWENTSFQTIILSGSTVDRISSSGSSLPPQLPWSSYSAQYTRKILGPSYPIGRDHFFWFQSYNICTIIQNITGVETFLLGEEEDDDDNEPATSNIAAKQQDEKPPPPIINLTLNCEEMEAQVGNWLIAIYHLRLVAALGRVDFQFQCSSGMASVETNILPWFSGYYPAPPQSKKSIWAYDLGWPDPNLVCSNDHLQIPIHHFAHEIQHDMRRIAVAMLGPRDDNSNHTKYVYDQHLDTTTTTTTTTTFGAPPLLSLQSVPDEFLNRQDIQVDDAAIHFRCGDVFGYTTKTFYGVMQFREYVKRIPKATTRTIGIHTQSFNKSLVRYHDRKAVETCKVVVGILVDYLQDEYPNATITVRNTQQKDDTIPLTYARLVMAAQTITSVSTFGIFPSIGTFGEGYFQSSWHINVFAPNISAYILSNLHTIDGPMLSSPEIAEKGWNRTIEFLTEKPL